MWSTSIAAAIAANNGSIARFPTNQAETDQLLSEHGVELHEGADSHTPQVGDEFLNRTDIRRVYGGNGVSGITRFTNDTVVNCFSDTVNGSYADDTPTPHGRFGYRGDGRRGDQQFIRGNRLLETARTSGSAIRFWHRPEGEAFKFLFWCVIIGRHWDRGIDDDNRSRKEIVWILYPVFHPLDTVPDEAREIGAAETANMDAGQGPEAQAHPSYTDLRDRASKPRDETHRETVRLAPIRSRAARRAVLIRADNKCEAPWCTGMPKDKLKNGDAILEVDHVNDLAGGGEDHPRNMVALCPNCHASKTRAANASERRRELGRIVRVRDLERAEAESSARRV